MRKEIELKYRVDNFDSLISKVGNPTGTHNQTDIYYAHPCKDFLETGEWLRLRYGGDPLVSFYCELTYKGARNGASRIELDVSVQRDMEKILDLLGFSVLIKVVKKRQPTKGYWSGSNLVSIFLDEVDGLGKFVELEIISHNDAFTEKCTEDLYKAAEVFGLKDEVKMGYAEMMLRGIP